MKTMNRFIYRKLIIPGIFRMFGVNFSEIYNEFRRFDLLSIREKKNVQKEKINNLQRIFAKNKYFIHLQKICESTNGVKDLSTVMEKQHLRAYCANLLSVRKHSPFIFKRKTSGTTGLPTTVLLNKEALLYQLAARYHSMEKHGIDIGSKEARMWGSDISLKNMIKDKMLNRKRFSVCSDKIEMFRMTSEMKKYDPDYIYGYSSYIYRFAQFLISHDLVPPSPKLIICTAEEILLYQKLLIEKVFRCKVVIEYGCSEVDIIAFECVAGKLHLISNNVVGKIDSGNNYGELLITDLNNTLSPIINYRIGDVVNIVEKKCLCGREDIIVESVEGRKSSRIAKLPNGQILHAHYFAYIFEEINKNSIVVDEFYVEQKTIKRFLIEIRLLSSVDDFEIVSKKISSKLESDFGKIIDFEIVEMSHNEKINEKRQYFKPLKMDCQ